MTAQAAETATATAQVPEPRVIKARATLPGTGRWFITEVTDAGVFLRASVPGFKPTRTEVEGPDAALILAREMYDAYRAACAAVKTATSERNT